MAKLKPLSLEWRYSGGETNTNPALSLGGPMSTVAGGVFRVVAIPDISTGFDERPLGSYLLDSDLAIYGENHFLNGVVTIVSREGRYLAGKVSWSSGGRLYFDRIDTRTPVDPWPITPGPNHIYTLATRTALFSLLNASPSRQTLYRGFYIRNAHESLTLVRPRIGLYHSLSATESDYPGQIRPSQYEMVLGVDNAGTGCVGEVLHTITTETTVPTGAVRTGGRTGAMQWTSAGLGVDDSVWCSLDPTSGANLVPTSGQGLWVGLTVAPSVWAELGGPTVVHGHMSYGGASS